MFEKKSAIVLGAFLIIISVSLVSAGLSDFLKLSGKASSQETQVSVTFKDTTPCELRGVESISPKNPTEASSTTVTFDVTVYNFDKLKDLNFSSVFAKFVKGTSTRGEVQCYNTQNLSKREAVFRCSIDMWYWDPAGNWTISVRASDIGYGVECTNDSTSFTYNELKAMVIDPTNITWSTIEAGSINQEAVNDPTNVNNTGNYNGTIEITGYDLYDELGEDVFEVTNFTSGVSNPCSGDVLSNNTAITITGASPNPGNLSAGGGAGQEQLYYCIPLVPNITAQEYSTAWGGSSPWVIAYGL